MPVKIVNDPEWGHSGKNGQVTQVVGAFYQMFFASTRAATKGTDAYHSPSAKGAGVTKYRVDIPKCKKDCQCLIVVSVEGSISGEVNAMASDWGFGKARATIDAKLYSSLGTAQAQLALASGDGADSYEASGEVGTSPKANVKIVGKVGEGRLTKISSYSSGPISFNACYADFSVTAEGSVNGYTNSWCDDKSFAEGHISTEHKCNISAYCVCDGQRELIFEYSRDRDSGGYSKRSDLDKEYEEKTKKDEEKLKTNVDKTGPAISKSEEAKLMKQLETGPKVPPKGPNDLLSTMRESLRRQASKKGAG